MRKNLTIVMNNRNKYNLEIQVNDNISLEEVMNSYANEFAQARYIHIFTENNVWVDINTNNISEFYIEDIISH